MDDCIFWEDHGIYRYTTSKEWGEENERIYRRLKSKFWKLESFPLSRNKGYDVNVIIYLINLFVFCFGEGSSRKKRKR